jgi:hypothetical protein
MFAVSVALLAAMTAADGPRIDVGTKDSVPRCENCVAPLLHSWDQHCTYCLAPIVQRTTVVVKGDGEDGT